MAYMRIHCGDCGMVKEVHKYVPDDTEVRYCPLCGSEIDRNIWETMIIPAVELLNKANRAIIAKHTEENTTPIYIDVIADHFTRDDMQDDSIMQNRQRKTVGAELKRRQLFKKGKKPNKFTYPRKW